MSDYNYNVISVTFYYFFNFKERCTMFKHETTVLEDGKYVLKDASQVDILAETVSKFKSFAEISKGNPSEKTKIGLPESLAQTNIFRDLFCDHPFRQGKNSSQVPIYLDLDLIQKAWSKIEFDENGNPNFESLKNGEYEKYIPALQNIVEVCMPYLSVKKNPNQFLKLALDYREKQVVFVRPNDMKKENGEFQYGPDKATINSPTLPLYIGLDRIAQFLNFCVLINSLPTKKADSIRKVEPLSFDKEVLKKLLNQVKAEKEDLKSRIQDFDNKTLDEYKKELVEYRKGYDNYVTQNQYQNICDVLTFVEWMDNGVRNANGINYSGLKNSNDDKKKLDILLYLDSILQCEAAIDKFIDSKALEPSILNWFKGAWNSIKSAWDFLANKMELSQRWICNIEQEEKDMQLKANEIIPELDFTKEKTNLNLNNDEKSEH